MQTQVRTQPRTGREPRWYYEVYRGNQPGPCESGQLFDFDAVKEKISSYRGVTSFVRVIGPDSATPAEISELREKGAYPTFP
jgi:hypothetical protein